ncbi:MAG: transglycosylase SLT domain-containing protein [Methylococcaceae bacterium]
MRIKSMCLALLWSALVLSPGAVFSDTLDQQRIDFLQAEKLLAQGHEDQFLQLSVALVNYPLYPYLQYQWLKNNLQQTDKVLAFLSTYKDTRYAGLLRDKWLEYLANDERWNDFIRYYQANPDNVATECLFYWANYKTGNQQLALNEAKRLWLNGESMPKTCDSLLSTLATSPVMTSDLLWRRFELALRKDNMPLAEYIRRWLDKADQKTADIWLQVHNKPELIRDSGFLIANDKQTGHIFAHAIERMAKSELDLAISIWDARKPSYVIDEQTAQRLERRLGLALAQKRDSRAYNRLDQLTIVDDDSREWKVRAALFEQNWQHVAAALAGLSSAQQSEPRWQYWQARALEATGHSLEAQTGYNKLAEDRSFYGFLAADMLNKPYRLSDNPVLLIESQIESLAAEGDFKMFQELGFLNRDTEANRQWWYAIKKLTKERLLIAAKLAQRWQLEQVAIMTLVKADYWDDLSIRFPVIYFTEVQRNANLQNLDPAVVLGLMRQESMLDKNARSAVGARGLMQVMPKTAQQIAHELNEEWQSDNSLFNPDVNIRYGSYYYKQLLDRFNGHFALATAAYNAGPNRIVKWLPTGKSMPADIWIETIPFKETRKYVTSVLSYSLIYQQRIQRNLLKMKNFMGEVLPG